MKQTQIVFQNTESLTNFILQYQPSKAEVQTRQCSLTAELTDQQIAIACSQFEGVLKKIGPVVTDEVYAYA